MNSNDKREQCSAQAQAMADLVPKANPVADGMQAFKTTPGGLRTKLAAGAMGASTSIPKTEAVKSGVREATFMKCMNSGEK